VHILEVDSTVESEVIYFNMTNSAPVAGTVGQFNLKIVRTHPTTFMVTYERNRTVNYGCSVADFKAALEAFDVFASAVISVEREIYVNGVLDNTVTDLTTATEVKYKVSAYKIRTAAQQSQQFIISKIPTTFSGELGQPVTVVEHSPLITGNFSFTIGGVSLNNGSIAFNAESWQIQNYLRTIVGY